MQHRAHTRTIIFPVLYRSLAAGFISLGIALLACAPSAYAVTAAEKQAEAEEALANLTAMQESLDRLSAEYGEALAAQEEAERKHDAAELRIGEIAEELDGLQDRLGERAREMYRTGGVSFLEMVLGASTFEEFATSLDMANRVNQSDADMVDRQRSLKAEAEDQEAVLEEQAATAARKSEEAEEAAAQAEVTVAEMQATYDSLSAEAAELLEEERKAREAEEAARAAAVLAAAKAQAEAEEAERAAREAAEREAAEREAQQQAAEQQGQAQDAASDDAAAEDAAMDDQAQDGAAEGDGTQDGAAEGDGTDATAIDDGTDATATDDGTDTSAEDVASETAEDPDNVSADDGAGNVDGDENENEDEVTDDTQAAQTDEAANEEQAAEDQGGSYEGGSDTVSRAYACLGAPYVWGGVGPGGYDCSGLVSYCLTGSHTRLGTTYTFMEWPSVSNPQPGDIAVNWGHTGVYIGDGQMIHAATYGVGVIIGPVQDGMKIVRYGG